MARTYAAKSSARTLLLEKEFNQLRKGLDEPLTMCFSRVRDIRDQLATAGEPISDEKVSRQVLLGLPGEYEILATVQETTEKKLSLEDLLAKCLVVEQRNTSAPAEDKAYFSKGGRSQPSAGQQAKPTSSESRKCYHCGKPGHLKRDCKKMQRDEQASGRQQDQQQPSNLSHAFGNMAFSALTTASGDEWALDSGASRHITGDVSKMTHLKQLEEPITITLFNRDQAKAEAMGDVVLKNIRGSRAESITLTDVLLVPAATVNLLSIARATSKGMHFLFNSKGCKIMKDGELVIMATYQNGVYGMSGNTALLAQETPMLWHRRFGHLGFEHLARLQLADMVTGIEVSESPFRSSGTDSLRSLHHGKAAQDQQAILYV